MTASEFDRIAADGGNVATTGLPRADSDYGRAYIDDAGWRMVGSINGDWTADLRFLVPGHIPECTDGEWLPFPRRAHNSARTMGAAHVARETSHGR